MQNASDKTVYQMWLHILEKYMCVCEYTSTAK